MARLCHWDTSSFLASLFSSLFSRLPATSRALISGQTYVHFLQDTESQASPSWTTGFMSWEADPTTGESAWTMSTFMMQRQTAGRQDPSWRMIFLGWLPVSSRCPGLFWWNQRSGSQNGTQTEWSIILTFHQKSWVYQTGRNLTTQVKIRKLLFYFFSQWMRKLRLGESTWEILYVFLIYIKVFKGFKNKCSAQNAVHSQYIPTCKCPAQNALTVSTCPPARKRF